MSFDLFQEENATIERVVELLKKDEVRNDALLSELTTLLKRYKKLFRSTKRIMRMSDRSEEKIKQAHTKIQQQQQQLTAAHSQLEEYAETLESKVRERTADLVKSQGKLERLVTMGIAISEERDIDVLLESILQGGKQLTNADAGTLYMRTDEESLKFSIVRTDSLGIAMGGPNSKPVFMPSVPLKHPATGEENHNNVAAHAALSGETVVIEDAYDSDRFDFSGVRQFDKGTGYRSQSFLTVPLRPRQGKVIGVLQLINATDPDTGEGAPFDKELVSFVEALAAQAAVTLDNQLLLKAQKDLFDAFIRLIASAIDAKSPYTGGHCERVPELAKLLAESACTAAEGPFADFDMTDDEHQEMHIASWLHDCGKVTTPEYVVDKATKLETIYNRIHEVRMRFEVLHRDAEIAYLKGVLNDWENKEHLKEEMEQTQAQLQEEFAFIARCNVGGEFMKQEDMDRIRTIADRRWTRHFDETLGLSHAELRRKESNTGQPTGPEEKLLTDKPDHIIHRERDTTQRDEELGIKMQAPKHLYNMGELHNLCIAKGTLTPEERYKINEHVVQSLAMLENLPFPDGMAQVPEFAGAHHETMNGTGYPRSLKREEMSVPARIMAIADIFEALTASDRPYKEPKTLSQAIRIMNFMKKDGHIDPDLFQLFLSSGVYQRYASKFLDETQIDDVDISPYLQDSQ
ncbi:MAG: GAF domain-containing protein [Magnetococcales bacterium]|nr:GAF domain-containing protein [Magnetococcales bacterium]